MTMYINKLNNFNFECQYIRRLMRKLHIKARIRQKKVNRARVKPEQVGENILHREFKADYPNQKWCTDVTEFKISGQKNKLYLSAIIDLFDRSIIAFKLSHTNNNELVFETLRQAREKYPNAKPIFHSDRGFQYTSKQFKILLDEANMIQSMSRVGKCIDNGPMEGFWGTLKSEMFYGIKFNDYDHLSRKIEEYIFFYNNTRLQSNLKGMTPNYYRYHSYCSAILF